jgi:hypothetical protein
VRCRSVCRVGCSQFEPRMYKPRARRLASEFRAVSRNSTSGLPLMSLSRSSTATTCAARRYPRTSIASASRVNTSMIVEAREHSPAAQLIANQIKAPGQIGHRCNWAPRSCCLRSSHARCAVSQDQTLFAVNAVDDLLAHFKALGCRWPGMPFTTAADFNDLTTQHFAEGFTTFFAARRSR